MICPAIPKGHLKVAKRFIAGSVVPRQSSPEGATENTTKAASFNRPSGTRVRGLAFPQQSTAGLFSIVPAGLQFRDPLIVLKPLAAAAMPRTETKIQGSDPQARIARMFFILTSFLPHAHRKPVACGNRAKPSQVVASCVAPSKSASTVPDGMRSSSAREVRGNR